MDLEHCHGGKSRRVQEGPRDWDSVPLGEAQGLVPKNIWDPLTVYEQNKDLPSIGQFGSSKERQTEIGGRA